MAKEKCEWDVQSHDGGAAEIAEKDPLDQEDQQASEDQVMQNRVRGEGDQGGAVVIGNDLDSRRQTPVVIQLVNGLFDLGNHLGGFFRSPHHYDRSHHIVAVVLAQNAEPGPKPDGHLADIPNQHRHSVRLGENNILDVIDLVTLPQIIIAAIINQADAADIDGLLANFDFAPAHVEVGIAQRRQDLRHRNAISFQLVRVHRDVKFLGGAAPTVDGGDAGNGQQATRHDPILDRTQIGDAEMLGTDDLIPIDFPRRAVGLDGGHQTAGQADVLLERHRGLGVGEVIVHPIFEVDPHKRQSIERGRADDTNAGRGVEPYFHGNRVVTFHLLGREAGRLSGNFQDHGRGVGIRLNIEQLESNKPGERKQHHAQHHNRAAAQAKGDESFKHIGPVSSSVVGVRLAVPFASRRARPNRGVRQAAPLQPHTRYAQSLGGALSMLSRNTAPSVTASSPRCKPARI